MGASQPAYACTTVLQPEPTAAPAPDATPRLGQVTRDLGRSHVQTGDHVRYEFCPPTSGPHYNDSRFGPIATRFYGADDATEPDRDVLSITASMTGMSSFLMVAYCALRSSSGTFIGSLS
mgnify:CR=1 FL=1